MITSMSTQKRLERELKHTAQALEATIQEAVSSRRQFSAAIDVSKNLETHLTKARAATRTINAELTEECKKIVMCNSSNKLPRPELAQDFLSSIILVILPSLDLPFRPNTSMANFKIQKVATTPPLLTL